MTSSLKALILDDRIRLYLQAEVRRSKLSSEELAERVKAYDIALDPAALTDKLERCAIDAFFFFAVLASLGCAQVRLRDLLE